MFNECFLDYILMVGGEYGEVEDVIDSFETLACSVRSLQEDLIEGVGKDLSIDNVDLSIKRLKSIMFLDIYSNVSFCELKSHSKVDYTPEFFDKDLQKNILKDSFVEDISNISPYLSDEFKVNLLDVYDSLEILYKKMARDLCSDIQSLDVNKDSSVLSYVTYLSPRLPVLEDTIRNIVEDLIDGTDSGIYDDVDKEAINSMCELLSFDIVKPNESIYFYIGCMECVDLDNDIYSIGYLLDSGYLDMRDNKSIYPVNQSIAITLRANKIEKEDVFPTDELYSDENDLIRIKLDDMLKRVCVNRNGKFQFVRQ